MRRWVLATAASPVARGAEAVCLIRRMGFCMIFHCLTAIVPLEVYYTPPLFPYFRCNSGT